VTTRIWTIPNAISVVRLALVPVFLWLLLGKDAPVAAAVLLAILGATDWVDGYISRHWDQGSELGKVLDPVADRALLLAAAVGLLFVGLPAAVNVVIVLMLVRELLIAVATLALALAGARRIDVVWAGKAGTLAVMVALPLFLWADSIDPSAWRSFIWFAAWCFAIGGLLLGYYAAAEYVPAARDALRAGRAERTTSGSGRQSSAEVRG
jgi:cardiolipin synthase (CMP-forming)